MEIWERQPQEGSKAYAAFCVYRDMGADRSLAATARTNGSYVSLIKNWKSKHSWEERAREWDNSIARKVHKEMVSRHIKSAVFLQGKSLQALKGMREESITTRDALTMYKMGIDVERIAFGEPTEIITSSESKTADPFDGLTAEELKQYLQQAKAQNEEPAG